MRTRKKDDDRRRHHDHSAWRHYVAFMRIMRIMLDAIRAKDEHESDTEVHAIAKEMRTPLRKMQSSQEAQIEKSIL
jgi:hypothetical protein